jgi:hypothetical protein
VAVTHPRKLCRFNSCPTHRSARSPIGKRTPAPQAGRMGSIPIRATWPSGGTGRHTTLRTSRLQRHGSSTLPLVTAEWTGVRFPARSHKPFDAGSNPASATGTAEYANMVKRPGREPGEGLWVRFPPRLLHDPVVQRRRLLAHIQATMVRVHPGSLVCRW